MESLIVHAYFTNGFFGWAKIFVESFRHTNGNDIRICLDGRDLSNNQIDELSSHKNITIYNRELNKEWLAKRAGIGVNELLTHKDQIEKVHVTDKSKIWKLMIAADDRVKSIREALHRYKDSKHTYMLHCDIDLYFRNKITNLFNLIRSHDISFRFRLNSKPNRKIMIGVEGLHIKKSIAFLDQWIRYVNDVKPADRPLGYGQTSCYYAYRDLKDQYKWGDIPIEFISPHMRPDDIIWSANTTKGKTENLQICRDDFRRLKNER